MIPKTFFVAFLLMVVSASMLFPKNATDAKTIQNLKSALLGETTASAKYADYSKKARLEGYTKIALLFEAASKSEKIHAANHRAVLEQLGEKTDKITPKFTVKSTKENLEDAIKGESYEVTTMYPEFLKVSNAAGVNLATISFNYAYQTEQKHKVMYQNALDKLNSKMEGTLPSQYFVCQTCGNTYDSQAPKRCGISMTPSDRFLSIK